MKKHSCTYLLYVSFFALSSTVTSAMAAPDFGPVAMGGFYTSIPELNPDAKLGTLIKVEKIHTTVANAEAWKIVYVSSDVQERKTLASGLIVAPKGVPPASRPIVAWAHGTTGTAQTCGPSQVLDPAQPLNQYFMPKGNSWTDFGIPAIDAFIKEGYVLVATDYQGLGAGGKHQYTVAATQARDVINSIRAASSFQEAHAGNKAIVYGWSQGGGATIAAAGLTDYLSKTGTARDGVELLGFVAMAPYDLAVTFPSGKLNSAEATKYLQQLGDSFSASVFNFTHYAQNLWGMVAAFPELRLNDILTDEGAQIADELLSRKCMHVASDTFNYAYGTSYKKLLRPSIKNATAWITANKKSSVMPIKPMAPVIIYFGNHDTTVPPVMGKLYSAQMCNMGANIMRVQLPGDQDHFSTPASAEPFYTQWIAERFAGKPAKNGCKERA